MKMTRAHVVISGLVQGVFFRLNTCNAAKDCGVKGWIRNNSNGTVDAMFEGSEYGVKKLLKWCQSGPNEARVDTVNVEWEDYRNEFKDFTVIYSLGQ